MKMNKKMMSMLLALVMLFLLPGTAVQAASKGYGFTYDGVTVYMHGNAQTLIDKMGTPQKKTKAKSCAYDGEDIKYVYKDFTLVTYTQKDGGTEYVQTITFTTKNAKTRRGIGIGSSEKNMKKQYGKARPKYGVYTYKKGKMATLFTVEDAKVTAVEYVAY